MLMRTLCRKTIKKGTPNSPMNGGQGVEVSKTLFYNGCPDNKNIFYIFFFQFFTVFLFYRIWFGRNGKRLGSNGNETNSVDLYEIMMTIQEHLFLQDVPGVKEHFWNLFMDALIGNTNRNE